MLYRRSQVWSTFERRHTLDWAKRRARWERLDEHRAKGEDADDNAVLWYSPQKRNLWRPTWATHAAARVLQRELKCGNSTTSTRTAKLPSKSLLSSLAVGSADRLVLSEEGRSVLEDERFGGTPSAHDTENQGRLPWSCQLSLKLETRSKARQGSFVKTSAHRSDEEFFPVQPRQPADTVRWEQKARSMPKNVPVSSYTSQKHPGKNKILRIGACVDRCVRDLAARGHRNMG